MKIGIIREGKTPSDARVALTPKQCKEAMAKFPIEIVVQPSKGRCTKDEAYVEQGIVLQEDLSDCDVLLGIKEVPDNQLLPNKTYFFFSHTIKKQAYNRHLLQAILAKKIRMIDYETLTDEKGKRLIAFGVFAGMVGAHNGLYVYGKRTGKFDLPRMYTLYNYKAAIEIYKTMQWPSMRIVLTGTGRVGRGAAKVLRDMGITEVDPKKFLTMQVKYPIFTILDAVDYVQRKDGKRFVKQHFYQNPTEYISTFEPYTSVCDIFINGIYWDINAPAFFTKEQLAGDDWVIQVIADVTCDIAPESSIPTTYRASTIANPVFGVHPITGDEIDPYLEEGMDMMTIDNLPNELPRDASESFGKMFMQTILPELLKPQSEILDRATISKEGVLTERYSYLQGYVDGGK